MIWTGGDQIHFHLRKATGLKFTLLLQGVNGVTFYPTEYDDYLGNLLFSEIIYMYMYIYIYSAISGYFFLDLQNILIIFSI